MMVNNSWYGWRCDHWGCKWNRDPDEINCILDDGGDPSEMSVYVYTPWNPPFKIFEALHTKGLTVRALYFEPNWPLYGFFENGKALRVRCGEIENVYGSMKNFYLKDPLGKELDEHFGALEYFEDDDDYDDDESRAA